MATPIGNLKDITLRALEVLKSVHVVAAEDTRVTAKLLNHYGVTVPRLIALHEHNERQMVSRIVSFLRQGECVALVSDAGTPTLSDPGARVIAAARAAGIRVVPIPGANAAVAAISASGLDCGHYLFHGFLPAKSAERRTVLEALAVAPQALVFYEAPHRVRETVADLASVLGGARAIVIARELTKRFETIHRCRLDEAAAWLADEDERRRGEFVLIVEGARPRSDLEEAERTLAILLEELPVKQAAALAARITGARKNALYARALALKERDS